MSDNLETSTETQEQTLQPVDSVVTGAEEGATPQSADDKIVIDVDEQEGGQETNAQSVDSKDSAMYLRMKKEKEKRKREHEERLKAEAEKDALRRELEELKSKVNPIVNPKPTLESCDYDNDRFEREIASYYQNNGNVQAKPQSEPQQQEQFNEQAFEVDYYTKERESEVSKLYPSYSSEKEGLIQKIKASGGNEADLSYIGLLAKQAGVDIAMANIGLNRSGDLYQELLNAFASKNPFNIRDVLQKAASKVDLRTSKKIDTLPTPDIQNSGPIDNSSASIQKAKEAWINNSSAKNFQAYQAAKKAAKA